MTAYSNYRVIHRKVPTWRAASGRDYEEVYGVHEVFYDEDGRPMTYTDDPVEHFPARHIQDIRAVNNHLSEALRRETLESWDFIGGGEEEH